MPWAARSGGRGTGGENRQPGSGSRARRRIVATSSEMPRTGWNEPYDTADALASEKMRMMSSGRPNLFDGGPLHVVMQLGAVTPSSASAARVVGRSQPPERWQSRRDRQEVC